MFIISICLSIISICCATFSVIYAWKNNHSTKFEDDSQDNTDNGKYESKD